MKAKTPEKPVWEPRNKDATTTAKFITYVNQKHNLNILGYDELHAWSTHDETLQDFWRDAYEWLELKPPDAPGVGRMLQSKDAISTRLYPPPACFPCDRFNIAEFLLRSGKDNDVAIHFAREGVAGVQRVSWGEIRERTREIRDAMINSGVAAGDVVAAVISNSVDAITLSLATTSIGAVWSSSSPDLGSDAIVDRYGQIGPKMIFVDDGYIYAGKMTMLQDRIGEWSHKVGAKSEQLLDVVVLPYCKLDIDLSKVHRGTSFQSFLQRGTGEELSFNMLPFSHPGFIVFSSGTGVALKVKTDMVLQHDIRKKDVVFQYTTTAWIMWIINFVNLSSGASMLLYDGSPYHPSPTTLLSLAQDLGYLMDLKKNGVVPRTEFDLSKLRLLTSTGSVLSADQYHWFYNQAFPLQVHLVSMSGGTDIAGCFVGGTPLLPVYPGEIQVKALGMAVDIMNAAETEPSSVANLNVAGELVCTRPFPSQPLKFLGKNGAEKYEASYFTRFGRGIWCQGDYIQRNPTTGGYVMLGRS
ncbi:hypothetical protein KJ359_003873 [Pestalotiopsis sp. 9143b]|nr:hypothetical protein KJ359_003873 [Pestalotiopsis sp. 9143b]